MVDAVNRNRTNNSIYCSSNFVVILAAFWVNFCLLGVQRSNAVIFRAFVDVFDVSRQHAAWPSGIFGFFMCVTGASSGFLTHYYSIRVLVVVGAILASASVSICKFASQMPHIVLLYGALQGIGMGLIVPLTHVVLNQNFNKNRACALGIAYSGSSAGSFIFPPLTNFLLSEYGLHGTFLVLGGIMSNSLIGTLLFRSPRKRKDSQWNKFNVLENTVFQEGKESMGQNEHVYTPPKGISYKQKLTNLQTNIPEDTSKKKAYHLAMEVLRNPFFFIISVCYAVYFSVSAIFLMVAVDFAKDRNITPAEGVFLISAFSIGDFIGRLTVGWVADTKCIRRSVLVRVYLIIMGIITVLLPVIPAKALVVTCVVFGIINGSIIVNHSVLLNEYLGIQMLPLAMGFSTCFVGVSAFFRPVVIGVFRDWNKSYDNVFYFMGFLQISVTLIWFLEYFVQHLRNVKNVY